MYAILWRYRVRPGSEAEFERIYGPEGDWARFFRRGEGYRRTVLLRGVTDTGEYVTLDEWVSEGAYRAFRREHFAEYQALDARCESLTDREIQIGSFESAG